MIGAELESEWQSVAEEIGVAPQFLNGVAYTLDTLSRHHTPTAEHCKRVGITAVRIGQHLELPTRPLFYGGSLHDRGKLFVAEELLAKAHEWTESDALALRNHPVDGYDLTINEGMVVTAGIIVRHHTFQPNSYPETVPPAPAFMNESFERCARVVSLADYYDAAHRTNIAGIASGQDIKAKILAHNPGESDLIHELYESGIFDTENRPF